MFPFSIRSIRPPAMSAQDAVAGAKRGEVIILDIREQAEVKATGKAKGAVNVPLMALARCADPRHCDHDARLSPEGKIAIYCATGARSAGAARLLRKLGYGDVHNIGSLAKWAKAGGAIVRA